MWDFCKGGTMKYLYSKIMEDSTDIVVIPFLTAEDLSILRKKKVFHQKVETGYLVNASQAKAIFCH